MKFFHALTLTMLAGLVGCSSIDVSSAHLRSSVPRYTAFTTEPPQAMAECISKRWASAGQPALSQQQTGTGLALQTAQKFEMTQKQPMMYLAIDISREGSTVRFYTNHVDDMNDRSMVSVIQSCH